MASGYTATSPQMSEAPREGTISGVRPVIATSITAQDNDPFASSREGSPRIGPPGTPPRIEIGTFTVRPQSSLHVLQDSPTSIEKRDKTGSVNSARENLNRDSANTNNGYSGIDSNLPLPPLPVPPASAAGTNPQGLQRVRTVDLGDNRPIQSRHPSIHRRQSAIDWIVPSVVESHQNKPNTVAARLQPTLDVAKAEKEKYAVKAKWTGWTLNAAIGLQVLLGSLTTGLSAVATSGKSAAMNTTILGALSTLVASYLARARGSNEPELSIARVKDLDQFIRECEAFKMDFGHVDTNQFDNELEAKRRRFEELLGNANGERRLAPPV